MQALELVLRPEREADVLVCVSHEGETALTLEAVQAWPGESWLITGKAESPLAEACDEVVVCTPAIEESWCHTASYTAAVAAIAALHGEDVAWLPAAVEEALAAPPLPVSDHERWLVAGAGRDWPTAQEAVLKLREGAYVAAEAHETEQLLHGYLAAVDESVRAFVLEGEGPRRRAGAAGRRGAGGDRRRGDARPDAPSRRRHRPVPAAHRRPRRAPRRRPRSHPARRPEVRAGGRARAGLYPEVASSSRSRSGVRPTPSTGSASASVARIVSASGRNVSPSARAALDRRLLHPGVLGQRQPERQLHPRPDLLCEEPVARHPREASRRCP